MPEFENLLDLIKDGRIEEAHLLIEAQRVKVKYAPDTITAAEGKAIRFTKKGKAVEVGEDGNWRLKPKTITTRKR